MNTPTSRLDVVDCLRGFAIVSIMLLHNIEHFDLYFTAQGLPDWMVALDKLIWDSAFFLFGGKSYAIFALLFGVTFYIQLNNREQKGEDFRLRFAWRLVLLLGFGLFNTLFYHGDILTLYAVVGLLLIPVARLGNGAVLAIAVLLMLQPYEWFNFFNAMQTPDMKMADPQSWAGFGQLNEALMGDSITRVWVQNLTLAKLTVVKWNWENGRFFQMLSLFMLGMLAARKGLFALTLENRRFWLKTLIAAGVLFVPLYMLKNGLPELMSSEAMRRPLLTAVASWSNLAFMLVLVSGFNLLFHSAALGRSLRIFAPIGRMSLTSYVMQSIIGTTLYYGFGFGLYKSTGATWCLLIGSVLALLQLGFSIWWLRSHRQGPLEALWHKATWAGVDRAA